MKRGSSRTRSRWTSSTNVLGDVNVQKAPTGAFFFLQIRSTFSAISASILSATCSGDQSNEKNLSFVNLCLWTRGGGFVAGVNDPEGSSQSGPDRQDGCKVYCQ